MKLGIEAFFLNTIHGGGKEQVLFNELYENDRSIIETDLNNFAISKNTHHKISKRSI